MNHRRARLPSMPGDPGQPRRPISQSELAELDREDYTAIREVVQHAAIGFERMSHSDRHIPKPLKDFLLFSFVAETDLLPSDCMIIAKKTERGDYHYGFDKRTREKLDLAEMLEHQTKKVRALEKEIEALKAELVELRRSR